jgi:prepilin-type N-terminal cleavage/methylation domain-containing protein
LLTRNSGERASLPSADRFGERGDTLIELLIAIVIIGISISAVLNAIIQTTDASVQHRSFANLDAVLKSFAESAKYDIQLGPSAQFTECATTSSYRVVSAPSPSQASTNSVVTTFVTGFSPNTNLTTSLGSTPVTTVLSGGTTDGSGNAAITYKVPGGLTNGNTYSVSVTDGIHTASSAGGLLMSSSQPVLVGSALANYTVSLSSLSWWNTSTKTFDPSTGTCATADKNGVQRLTFTAAAPDHTGDSNDVIVTNPTTTPATFTGGTNTTTFTTGTAGSYTFTASGYPAPSFTETGALPSGVSLSTSGLLSGTPAAGTGGSYVIVVSAANSGGSANQTFTLVVDQAPAITSANHATFAVGSNGSFTVTDTGYPAPTLSETGALPNGVTFNAATGILSGTPAAGTGGTYTVSFTASNGVNPNATQNFTLTVNQAPAITSGNSTTFTVGTNGSFTVMTTGFPTNSITDTNFTGCTKSALPGGVTFTDNGNNTATLSGIPGTSGTYTLCINAANGVGTPATQKFTLTVNQTPAIASANNTTFTVGFSGTFTVTTSGFPTNSITDTNFTGCTKSALPGGVTFTDNGNNTATLSGTPGTSGTYTLCINAANGVGTTATQKFTLTVNQPQAPVITSPNTAQFTKNQFGSFTVTASGSPSPTFSVTGGTPLPAGLSLDPNSGVISGTPTQKKSTTVTITASNGVNPNATQSLTITVN